jgi:hypothetical protein
MPHDIISTLSCHNNSVADLGIGKAFNSNSNTPFADGRCQQKRIYCYKQQVLTYSHKSSERTLLFYCLLVEKLYI